MSQEETFPAADSFLFFTVEDQLEDIRAEKEKAERELDEFLESHGLTEQSISEPGFYLGAAESKRLNQLDVNLFFWKKAEEQLLVGCPSYYPLEEYYRANPSRRPSVSVLDDPQYEELDLYKSVVKELRQKRPVCLPKVEPASGPIMSKSRPQTTEEKVDTTWIDTYRNEDGSPKVFTEEIKKDLAAKVKTAISGLPTWWSAYLQSLAESPELAEMIAEGDFAKEISEMDDGFLQMWSAITKYQGFDIAHVFKVMRESEAAYLKRNKKMTIEIKYRHAGTDVVRTVSNMETMAYDMKAIIFIFITRGSTWKKVNEKSLGELSVYLEWMKSKYSIDTEDREANQTLAPDVVSMPRIAACMPQITCGFYHHGHGKALVSLAELGLPASVSRAVLCPFLVSLLPRQDNEKDRNPHMLFFLVHVYVDDVIHRKQGSKTDLLDMYNYYHASFDCSAINDTVRTGACSNYKIWADGAFSADILNVAKDAEKKIRDLRPNDDKLDSVINSIKDLCKV